jgi:FAD/FMN-containing dehydrogenase
MELTAASIQSLAPRFNGRIITPIDPDYDTARRVWNVMIDRRPALILQPRTAADEQAAVRFSLEQRLPLAVRGAAHGVAGMGTGDDALVID